MHPSSVHVRTVRAVALHRLDAVVLHGSATVILVRDTLSPPERDLLLGALTAAFAPADPPGWVRVGHGTAAALLATPAIG